MATSPKRISILLLFFFVVVTLIAINNNGGVEAFHRILPELQSIKADVVNAKHRTGYHFQPPKHWINDPNGPLYHKGIYHLFYQYNPKGSVWGNIVWAHSISIDLINWIPLEPAMYPSKPFDINGCWSGGTTILPGNKPVIIYTGIDAQKRQVQNIAYPKNLSDPLLREWIKPDYNPVMVPDNEVNASSFRDPTTAWYGKDGLWRLLVGNEIGQRGVALLYKSRDFKKWTKSQHPLHSAADTGMWECPDFFPVSLHRKEGLDTSVVRDGIKHVLKVSLDDTRYDYYTVGRYFPEEDRYVPDNTSADNSMGLRYDYGNFYASKTFFDGGKNRRILWGWANESDTPAEDVKKGWAGIQAIPRTILLDENERQIVQWPVEELEALRSSKIQMTNIPLTKESRFDIQGISAAQADVEVTFSLPSLENAEPFDPSWVDAEQVCGKLDATIKGTVGPFGLLTLASDKLEEYTAVFFRIFKSKDKHVVLMCSGGTKSSLSTSAYKPSFGGFVDVDLKDGKLSLRSLVDNSVVESFGAGGKTCITSRVYPKLAVGEDAHLYVFNYGKEPINIVKLNAWTMRRPQMN